MTDNSHRAQSPDDGPRHSVPDFYHSLGNEQLVAKIRNMDDPTEFDQLQQQVRLPTSRNFFVDVGDDNAWSAFDLSDNEVKALLSERKESRITRWINIWFPYNQKDLIKTLAKHYDFSPRLYALMKSDHAGVDVPGATGIVDDVARSINHYRLIDQMWYWSTVDEGRRYISLGYNTLHGLPTSRNSPTPQDPKPPGTDRSDVPAGKRVWSWLVLCEDKTVISIHEDPYPGKHGAYGAAEQDTLRCIRRNLLTVFQNLSKCFNIDTASAVEVLPIRWRVGDSDEERVHRTSDAPGLLFYNLFDDWGLMYNLVARSDYTYAAALKRLQAAMMHKADLAHIEALHCIGRQLSLLKRMYQNYEVMIDRVLEKQEPTLASLKNSHIISRMDQSTLEDTSYCSSSNAHKITEEGSMLGVALSSAARARFKRLKYRLQLYAISEIDECLSQKESLVMMNLSLIGIKESFSVERLTRVTLLLAKATLLFMPVSIMAAYFSCQFTDKQFTVANFWTWFAVIFSTSAVGLIAFSIVSGTMEGKMLYRSFSRTAMDVTEAWWGRLRASRRRDGYGEAGLDEEMKGQ